MSSKFKVVAEATTFVLAVVAIVFAVIQFLDSQELKHRIQDLLAEASTKYVGLFPENMAEINNTVNKKPRELRVFSDYPGYGHYSRPANYAEYENNILKLRKNSPPTEVRMLFYSAAAQRANVEDQFKSQNWDEIRKSDVFKDFFGTYHADYETPASYDQFINVLLKLQNTYEKKLCNNGVEVEHIDQPSVLFFWLNDEDRAVFSIHSRDEKERELSFQTSDGKLTHAFKSIFDRFWHDNQHDPSGCNLSPPPPGALPGQ